MLIKEKKVLGGSQQISDGLARLLGKDTVKLNTPIAAVTHDDDGATVTDITGKKYRVNAS